MSKKVENGTGILGALLGIIGGGLMFVPEIKKIVSYVLFGISAVCTIGLIITKTIRFFKGKKLDPKETDEDIKEAEDITEEKKNDEEEKAD